MTLKINIMKLRNLLTIGLMFTAILANAKNADEMISAKKTAAKIIRDRDMQKTIAKLPSVPTTTIPKPKNSLTQDELDELLFDEFDDKKGGKKKKKKRTLKKRGGNEEDEMTQRQYCMTCYLILFLLGCC